MNPHCDADFPIANARARSHYNGGTAVLRLQNGRRNTKNGCRYTQDGRWNKKMAAGTPKMAAGTKNGHRNTQDGCQNQKMATGTPKMAARTQKMGTGTPKMAAGTLKMAAGTPKMAAGTRENIGER